MDEQHAGRACETCRLRRVKCDKRLPGCARCQKLGQPCSGYKTERRFFDDGAKVRRKFGDDHQSEAVDTKDSPPKNGTVHRSPEVNAATLPVPGSFFNTILGDTVRQWRPTSGHGTAPKRELPRESVFSVTPQSTPGQPQRPSLYPRRADSKSSIAQPKPLTIPATDPYANPPTAQLLGNYNAYDIAADATPAPAPDEDFFDLDLDAYYANGNNACGFIPGLPVIMSDINDIDPNETDTIGDTESMAGSIATKSYSARRRVGRAEADDRGQETAMLLRHFVEIMAPWMDILDIDGYFSRIMPLKATDNVMLRSALAAVAAKRIANVGGAHDRDLLGGHMLPHSDLPNPTTTSKDWFYKAASYYDKAISHLRIHLHRLAQAPPREHEFAVPAPVEGRPKTERRESTASQDSLRPVKRRRVPQTHTRDSEIDDLLSAISVFSLYESLDNASVGFSQHLNGMQSLLEDKFRSRRMSGTIAVPPSARVDKAATAAFWNFAREDLLTAYSTRAQHTRLDPTDIALWNAAGLPITFEDFASSHMNPLLEKLADEGGQTGREEVFVAVLIWILMRVVSLVNSEHTAPSMTSDTFGTPRSAASPGSTESAPAHAQQWQNLRGLLDGWYESLPITFDPYAELDYEPEVENVHHGIKKLFYSLPLAAAALALYHFGQILLILNQPMELTQSRTPASRMRFMRAMTEESQSHARHICGIALGGPQAAVQRQLAQPLHLAGSCLEDDKDRRLVISLLQGIGLEANCVTQGLISDLYSEWEWHT